MPVLASRIPIPLMSGLRPQAWVCVGAGFAREDVKALILGQGQALAGDAVTSVQEIARKIVSASRPGTALAAESVLGPLARQEVLRILLAEKRISARMQELKRLRRQGSFYKRLDAAIQMGRMSFAHAEEESVYDERLQQRLGPSVVREEVRALASAYEAWLESTALWDPPLLIRAAAEALASGWPAGLARPREVRVFSVQAPESLERHFWDAVGAHVEVSFIAPEGIRPEPGAEGRALLTSWERWHTLDDAAERLADALAQAGPEAWARDAVLIPGVPAVRRTLKRALDARGIPLAEPRDPEQVKWEEGVKWAMLPLELVSRNFERDRVIAFLRAHFAHPELGRWIVEINERGIRNGLRSYGGGRLSLVGARLTDLAESLGGRLRCAELAENHLAFLRAQVGAEATRNWLVPFFEGVWKEFVEDTARVGQGERKAPLLYWVERFQLRVAEAPAPVERVKPERGVRVYRLQQAPLIPGAKLWILGMPPAWTTGEGVGDYWFTEREREVLGAEFAVRSAIQIRKERLAALASWLHEAEEVVLLDAHYDHEGRERETIGTVVRELECETGAKFPVEGEERGSHPRWVAGYGALRPVAPLRIQLPALPPGPGGAKPEITATALENYSRCGFKALAMDRWKLQQPDEPDTELWFHVRGVLLHSAVRTLVAARDSEGRFGVSPEEALDAAWQANPPKGLLRGERVVRYVRSRLLTILTTFCEKEREYVQRARTEAVTLDDRKLRLEYPEFALIGKPDRIDRHPDGLFIIDYKTSSGAPSGTEMLENGYRVQLPFYALAAQKTFEKPAIGVQFVLLTKKGERNAGVFFKAYNGKEPGKLTKTTGNSRSLLTLEPGDVWARFEEHIQTLGHGLLSGVYEARPRSSTREKECRECRAADLCGLRRLGGDADGAEGTEE